jgi:hypothetical protein
MALEFFTGFDHYATADLLSGVTPRWNSYLSATIQSSVVRSGSSALNVGSSISYIHKMGLSNATTRILGFAFRHAGSLAETRCIAALSDGSPATAGNCQVGIRLQTTGAIGVYRGVSPGGASGTQLGSNSTNLLSANTWYYIELVVTHSNTVGTVDVYVNGTTSGWISLTGQDTMETANAYSNAFGFACSSNSVNQYFDDVYTVSGSGGTHTTRLGDVKCVAVNASTGDGAVAQFTPSTGTDNGAMVDEATPDGATTYNESTVVSNIDTYAFPAIGASGTIYGCQIHDWVAKTDAGTCDAQTVARISATNYFGTQTGVSTSYGYLSHLYETSPATASAWTASEIDGAEFGVKHTA